LLLDCSNIQQVTVLLECFAGENYITRVPLLRCRHNLLRLSCSYEDESLHKILSIVTGAQTVEINLLFHALGLYTETLSLPLPWTRTITMKSPLMGYNYNISVKYMYLPDTVIYMLPFLHHCWMKPWTLELDCGEHMLSSGYHTSWPFVCSIMPSVVCPA